MTTDYKEFKDIVRLASVNSAGFMVKDALRVGTFAFGKGYTLTKIVKEVCGEFQKAGFETTQRDLFCLEVSKKNRKPMRIIVHASKDAWPGFNLVDVALRES